MSGRADASGGRPPPGPLRRQAAVFLPREHGAWSLALEPLALGLIAAPSAAGLCLALAAVSGFFARRPVRSLTLSSGNESSPGSLAAAALLALCAGTGLAEAAMIGGLLSLWALLLAAPLGALFLFFDLRRNTRALASELAGAATFSVIPAALAVLGGWPALPALALAAIMSARSIPTVVVVRYAVRLAKGQAVRRAAPVVAAASGMALVAALALASLAPRAVLGLAALLLARAVVLVCLRPATLAPRALGVTEAVIGAVFVAGTALAYRL